MIVLIVSFLGIVYSHRALIVKSFSEYSCKGSLISIEKVEKKSCVFQYLKVGGLEIATNTTNSTNYVAFNRPSNHKLRFDCLRYRDSNVKRIEMTDCKLSPAKNCDSEGAFCVLTTHTQSDCVNLYGKAKKSIMIPSCAYYSDDFKESQWSEYPYNDEWISDDLMTPVTYLAIASIFMMVCFFLGIVFCVFFAMFLIILRREYKRGRFWFIASPILGILLRIGDDEGSSSSSGSSSDEDSDSGTSLDGGVPYEYPTGGISDNYKISTGFLGDTDDLETEGYNRTSSEDGSSSSDVE